AGPRTGLAWGSYRTRGLAQSVSSSRLRGTGKILRKARAQLRACLGNDPRRSRSGTIPGARKKGRAPGKETCGLKHREPPMMKSFSAPTVLISALFFLAGCAKPPKLEVSLSLEKQNADLI